MLKVAVGVIRNKKGDVLISERPSHVHQGGLWEFPGGKLEPGESSYKALKRELFEELNISISSAKPLVKIYHQYENLSVLLDVYTVDDFQGEARGMENQAIRWVAVSELKNYSFPAANKRIIDTLKLPRFYPIVDETLGDSATMLAHLDKLIDRGYTMIQWRANSLNDKDYKQLAIRAMQLCEIKGVRLFLNTRLDLAIELNAHAVHLSADNLTFKREQVPDSIQLAASCHTAKELERAHDVGALFSLLSPVCATKSHPGEKPLGWDVFATLAGSSTIPIFALGGLGPDDIETALLNGAQGVSGIRAF
ncbi:MAG: Nudix family hydrolase [Cycloclasticus sp.]